MDRGSVPRVKSRRKGAKHKRPPGLAVIERDGFWHIVGTVVAKGRKRRVRTSSRLEATPELWEAADAERLEIEQQIRAELRDEIRPGPHISVAAELYLSQKRSRPLGATAIGYVKRAVRAFGLKRVGDVPEYDWSAWVDKECANVTSQSRERLLNAVMAFLNWCAKKPRRWGTPPTLDRDKEARNPRRRARRPVAELTIELIEHLFSHAAPHLAAQLWVEWSTGARKSSILHGCRLCDAILATGREQITFHATKNNETVTAHLHPRAAEAVRIYLKTRGRLHDREGPLFLTHRHEPYSSTYGQNRTAFAGMKRRARRSLRIGAMAEVRRLARLGQHEASTAVLDKLRADHRLLGRVTQHWFRHMLATKLRGDVRAAMDQGGWIDERSVMGYTIDVPEHRRRLINELDAHPAATPLTRRRTAD